MSLAAVVSIVGDAGMGERAADKGDVGGVGQLDVVDIATPASDQSGIFAAADRTSQNASCCCRC